MKAGSWLGAWFVLGCASSVGAGGGDAAPLADTGQAQVCREDVWTTSEDTGRPRCNPATEYLYVCQGGGGCSRAVEECRPMPTACAAGCERCACARSGSTCSYPMACYYRSGGLLTLSCPPD